MTATTPNWIKTSQELSPQVGQENQFASTRGLRFGPLRVNKTGIFANNGTVDSVTINSDGFHGFTDAGVETLRVDASGISGYGTSGNALAFYNAVGGTLYGLSGYLHSSTTMYLSSSAVDMTVRGAVDLKLIAETDVDIGADNDVHIIADVDASTAGKVYVRGADTGTISSSGVYFYDWDSSAYVEKKAIVPTSKGYNALYCTESPEVWFMDFAGVKGRGWRFWKKKEIVCDKMFLEVTVPPYHIIPTVNKKIVQIWGKRKGLENKRFESKTKAEFDANNKFWNTPNLKVKNK